jgi:hypothetical protein
VVLELPYTSGKFDFSVIAAKDESAPPKEWPVVTMEYPECKDSSVLTTEIISLVMEFHLDIGQLKKPGAVKKLRTYDLRNPLCTLVSSAQRIRTTTLGRSLWRLTRR